jgi:hypothetical protein
MLRKSDLRSEIDRILADLPDELTRAEINEFVRETIGPKVIREMAYEGLSTLVQERIRAHNQKAANRGETQLMLASVMVTVEDEDGETVQKEVRRLASVLTPEQRAQHCTTFHVMKEQASGRERQVCAYHAGEIGGQVLQGMLLFALDPDIADL